MWTYGGDIDLTSFCLIVNTYLSCKDMTWQNAMVPRWWIFGDLLHPAFPASRMHHISDLHSKFALGPHHLLHLISGRWD